MNNRNRNQAKDWFAIIPINNLVIEGKIDMGQAIFYPAGSRAQEWKRKLNKIIDSTKHTGEEKSTIKQTYQKQIDSTVIQKPYLVVVVNAKEKEKGRTAGYALKLL